MGKLLAFYEAHTVYEAFIWDINPFDQFGVGLGKIIAGGIRSEMAAKNENPDHQFSNVDSVTARYLDRLFD